MAKVLGKKGTINEGALGDLPLEDPLSDETRPWHRMVDEGEVSVVDEKDAVSSVKNLAEAVIRGDEISNPVEQEKVKEHNLLERAHDVVLRNDEDAQRGDHVEQNDEVDTRLLSRDRAWEPGEDYTLQGVQKRNAAAVKARAVPKKADEK